MEDARIIALLKWIVARLICAPAVFMPYRIRIYYIEMLSSFIHAPFFLFGKLAHFLLDRLHVEPELMSPPERHSAPRAKHTRDSAPVAVLFSGGSDSLCAAALMAQESPEVHLLTFYEYATRHSPSPAGNAALLQQKYSGVHFLHHLFSVDQLVRFFWYERYPSMLVKHGLLVLATCGFSSLAWHVRTISYCLDRGITRVADGLTRELMHFPGHMDEVIEQFRSLYAAFGITYENPVRSWSTPPDRQLIDHVLVNRHGGFLAGEETL